MADDTPDLSRAGDSLREFFERNPHRHDVFRTYSVFLDLLASNFHTVTILEMIINGQNDLATEHINELRKVNLETIKSVVDWAESFNKVDRDV